MLAFSSFIYYLTFTESKDVFRKRLKSRASNNAQVFDYSGEGGNEMLRRIDAGALTLLPQKTVIITDSIGNIFYEYNAEDAIKVVPDSAILSSIRQSYELFFNFGNRNAIGIDYKGQKRNFIIIVAASDDDSELRLAQLKNVLFIGLLLGIMITVVVGII